MMTSFNPVHKLTEIATTNSDIFKSAVDISVSATEQLLALNLNTFRALSSGYAPIAGDNAFEQIAARFKAPGQSLEQTTEYFRSVTDICVKTQSEFARLNADCVNKSVQSLNALLDSYAKSGPAGTAEVVGKLKTAINSVTEAYENMLRTTQEATETQLAAASHAFQPIVASAKASKKAA